VNRRRLCRDVRTGRGTPPLRSAGSAGRQGQRAGATALSKISGFVVDHLNGSRFKPAQGGDGFARLRPSVKSNTTLLRLLCVSCWKAAQTPTARPTGCHRTTDPLSPSTEQSLRMRVIAVRGVRQSQPNRDQLPVRQVGIQIRRPQVVPSFASAACTTQGYVASTAQCPEP
jgi:hypothetical protein